jgi:hypothetical protein
MLKQPAPYLGHGSARLRFVTLSTMFVVSACQRPTANKEDRPLPSANSVRPAPPETAHFDSPRAVYKRYAETLNASEWPDAIALFTPAGKTGLIVANFKGLALLAATQHPKQQAYKAVLREFCQANALRCADEDWNAAFTSTLLEHGDVTRPISDVAGLATAKPEETYTKIMKLLQGVDANSIVPLDPTLTEVIYVQNTATGVARRADGVTYTMSFVNASEHGWQIVE